MRDDGVVEVATTSSLGHENEDDGAIEYGLMPKSSYEPANACAPP